MMGAKNQFVKKNPNIYLFDRKLIVVASKLVMKHKRHGLRNLCSSKMIDSRHRASMQLHAIRIFFQK